jgi:hypothetical protein
MATTPSFRSLTAPGPVPRRLTGRPFRAAVALLLAVPLAACATKRDVRDLGDEIRAQNQAQAELIAELRSGAGGARVHRPCADRGPGGAAR